jgi:hypothetical protein
MDPLTIISILSQFAPAILKHFGAGATAVDVASKAGDIARAVTGKDTTDAAVSALKDNPELQLQFNKAIIDQETTFEQLYMSDKADARARDIKLSETPMGNVRANWLVAIAVIVIFTILGVVVFRPEMNEYAKGVLTGILGMYIQQLANIYAFEFGTTRKSADKDNTIQILTNKV